MSANSYAGRFSTPAGQTGANEHYWADFLFEASSQYPIATYFVAQLRQGMHFGYFQDDWKVLPNLTLHLGLRYEYGTPYWEQKNRLSNFNPAAASLLWAKSGDIYDRSLVNPDMNEFAPRVGFASALTPTPAIQGGYGISYVHYNSTGSGNILAINAPQALFVTANQISPTAATYRRSDQGFPADSSSNFSQLMANITYIPKDSQDSYVHRYYLSAQRSLAKNTLIDVDYVGNRVLKLMNFSNFNQKNPSNNFQRPIPTWGDIAVALSQGYPSYNSLQARYEQRMVGGLTLLNSFTWSQALDNDGASWETATPAPQDFYNQRAEYGQSDYNQPIVNTTSMVTISLSDMEESF